MAIFAVQICSTFYTTQIQLGEKSFSIFVVPGRHEWCRIENPEGSGWTSLKPEHVVYPAKSNNLGGSLKSFPVTLSLICGARTHDHTFGQTFL